MCLRNILNTWSSLEKNCVLFDSVLKYDSVLKLIKVWEILLGHTLQISFTNLICLPEHFRSVWPRDLKTILWEAAFPAPGELTHKAADI